MIRLQIHKKNERKKTTNDVNLCDDQELILMPFSYNKGDNNNHREGGEEGEEEEKPRQLAHFNGNEAKKITRETHPPVR